MRCLVECCRRDHLPIARVLGPRRVTGERQLRSSAEPEKRLFESHHENMLADRRSSRLVPEEDDRAVPHSVDIAAAIGAETREVRMLGLGFGDHVVGVAREIDAAAVEHVENRLAALEQPSERGRKWNSKPEKRACTSVRASASALTAPLSTVNRRL